MDLEQQNVYVQKLIVIRISSVMVKISIWKVLLESQFSFRKADKITKFINKILRQSC